MNSVIAEILVHTACRTILNEMELFLSVLLIYNTNEKLIVFFNQSIKSIKFIFV